MENENLTSAEYTPSLTDGLPVTDTVFWKEKIHIKA